LADGGKALASILVPASADRVTRFAAAELKTYLGKISGADFQVREVRPEAPADGEPAICLGPGRWEETPDPSPDPCEPPFDGFTIRSRGDRIFIRGRNSRSTLFGVYAFLEDLGCAFIEPGIERIPQGGRLSVHVREREETAAFPLRNLYWAPYATQKKAPFTALAPETALPEIDWMAKRRLNHYEFYVNFFRYDLWEKHKGGILDALLDRGFDLEVTHHSLHYFCPPDENHDFGDFGPATYLRNHPDWYLPGLECGARGRWQTRVELPEVRAVIIERFLKYVQDNPELKIVGLWPDDIPINAPSPGLSATDGYMEFWNRAGEALAGAFPDKRLAIVAYFDLTPPPQSVKPRENLHCWYCPISRNLVYPVDDRRNGKFLAWLKGWIKQMPPWRVGSFEYYGWQMEYRPLRLAMARDLPLYQELGLGGVYGWTSFVNNILGEDCRWALDMFVLTHLLWDTRSDLRTLEETWAKGVFGPAATAVLDFYDFLREAHDKEVRLGLAPNYQWIAFDVVHKAQQILERARTEADSPGTARRVDLLEKVLCRGATEEVWREGGARVV